MLYHINARGDDKACIFADEGDHHIFLQLLAERLPRFDAKCLAYALMWNHYHALLKAGRFPLWRLMQSLNSTYCQAFNRKHGRVGHVLQGRYDGRLVEDGGYARIVLRYIALNPIEAKYVADPVEWRWSSYRFALGAAPAPSFLALDEVWSVFDTADPGIGRARLEDFVSAGVRDAFTSALLAGSDRLAAAVAPLLEPHQQTIDYIYAERHAARPSVGSLFEGRFTPREVDDASYTAFYVHAYTLAEIARIVGRHPSVVCRWIQREKRRREAVVVSPG